MKQLSAEEVLALVQAGEDDALVGCYETETVEFKGEYRLTEQSERWELAKDVAALPNADGGIIVVGVRTRLDQDRAGQRAQRCSHRPLPNRRPGRHARQAGRGLEH